LSAAGRKKILIIEDEADIAASLKYNLEKSGGYAVATADSGEEGLALARQKSFDLVILDLRLPGMDRLEVCRTVRASAETAHMPLLMLTARVEETDKLVGLEMGADDYLTKPFSMKEVLARVRALLRRARRTEEPAAQAYHAGGIEIDFDGHVLRSGGKEVPLTRMEFALLSALVKSRGRVLTRDHLLQKVWGYEYAGATRTVDVHVRRLRQKLGPPGDQIETIVGVGYRFRERGGANGDT